jgi:hypothetical protein
VLAGCGTGTGGAVPPSRTATEPAVPSPIPPSPAAPPAATAVAAQQLADEGTMFPGTYKTKLDPPMTITINRLVDLDCAPGYRCRGDIDVNLPQWVGFEFGNTHGSYLDIQRLDKVYAQGGKALVDPPEDLAAWWAARPGMEILAGPTPVQVGGVSGTQLDAQAHQVVPVGSSDFIDPSEGPVGPGAPIRPGPPVRLTFLKVASHWVVITETWGPENSVHDFDAVTRGLQPVVDSIVWN